MQAIFTGQPDMRTIRNDPIYTPADKLLDDVQPIHLLEYAHIYSVKSFGQEQLRLTVHGFTCIPSLCACVTIALVVKGLYPGRFGSADDVPSKAAGDRIVAPIESAANTICSPTVGARKESGRRPASQGEVDSPSSA